MTKLVGSKDGKLWFVGANIGVLPRDEDLIRNPEIRIPDTGFSLFPQEKYAWNFKDPNAVQVQADLRRLGVWTELVKMP
jgi:hypothetical protein